MFRQCTMDYGEETISYCNVPDYRKTGPRQDSIEVSFLTHRHPCLVLAFLKNDDKPCSISDQKDTTDDMWVFVQYYRIERGQDIMNKPKIYLTHPRDHGSYDDPSNTYMYWDKWY